MDFTAFQKADITQIKKWWLRLIKIS
jgi:hypothetical protein